MLKLVWSLVAILCNWWSSPFSHAPPNKDWFLCVCTEKVTMRSGCVWLCSLFLVAVLKMCEATAELRQGVVQNSCHFCEIAVWGDGFGCAFWMFWTSTNKVATEIQCLVLFVQLHFTTSLWITDGEQKQHQSSTLNKDYWMLIWS